MGLESFLLSKCFWFRELDQENVSLIPEHIDSQLEIHRPQKNVWFYARAASVGVELAPRTPQDPWQAPLAPSHLTLLNKRRIFQTPFRLDEEESFKRKSEKGNTEFQYLTSVIPR